MNDTVDASSKSQPHSSSATSGSLKAQQGLGVWLGWVCEAAGTPSLFTHQFQAEPCRCSHRVASIIERIDLGCASNPMRVLISLTAAFGFIFEVNLKTVPWV